MTNLFCTLILQENVISYATWQGHITDTNSASGDILICTSTWLVNRQLRKSLYTRLQSSQDLCSNEFKTNLPYLRIPLVLRIGYNLKFPARNQLLYLEDLLVFALNDGPWYTFNLFSYNINKYFELILGWHLDQMNFTKRQQNIKLIN